MMTRLPLPVSTASTPPRWGLGAAALAVGLLLMLYYVQLLQESVTRGAQWRQAQANAFAINGARPAPQMRLVSASR